MPDDVFWPFENYLSLSVSPSSAHLALCSVEHSYLLILPEGMGCVLGSRSRGVNFHPLPEHIHLPLAGNLAIVKMLKLEFGPRYIQRLPHGTLPSTLELPSLGWGRGMNLRLRLGHCNSRTTFGAGHSDFPSLAFSLPSMGQCCFSGYFRGPLAWWSPTSSPPSAKQSQTRV